MAEHGGKNDRAREQSTKKQAAVDATPTKRFFVEMLTRDIELDDAILDLLDNCLDGILRNTEPRENDPTPYKKFRADITFNRKSFSISDNCGGIDRDLALKSAFRMGKPDDATNADEELATVGVYGIGMKRAIFKMGRVATVTSRTSSEAFEVNFTEKWMATDKDWTLPFREIQRTAATGTTIDVSKLDSGVAANFADSDFEQRFIEKVATHYGLIIHKGFKVTINGAAVTPTPIKFLLQLDKSKRGVAPYLYEGTVGDVDIKMAVGFYRPTPTQEEVDAEQDARRSKEDAGWTIVCNDRVVLYCDRTHLTGWGEAGVPSFHSQFIAIAGIVEFRSVHAKELPVTTTKRGIDANSKVYSFAKNYMREGMKHFTNYTYKWKGQPGSDKELTRAAKAVALADVRAQIPEGGWRNINKNDLKERKFVPDLPAPPTTTTDQNLRFTRPAAQVRRVSGFLFGGDKEQPPSEVGAKAFDWVHEKAKS